MQLSFIQKTVFGKIMFYPNNDAANAICQVAGQKTMTHSNLQTLKAAGFSIAITTEKVEL